MKVIALQENEKRGKTTTLKILIDIIGHREDATFVAKRTKYTNSKDTWAIFNLNGKIVAITTRGDTRKCIEDDLKNMLKETAHIDVFVCAVHESGQTVECVNDLSGEDTLLIIGKAYVFCPNDAKLQNSQRAIANAQQAISIMEAIENI